MLEAIGQRGRVFFLNIFILAVIHFLFGGLEGILPSKCSKRLANEAGFSH